jgi:hypothetical protein
MQKPRSDSLKDFRRDKKQVQRISNLPGFWQGLTYSVFMEEGMQICPHYQLDLKFTNRTG